MCKYRMFVTFHRCSIHKLLNPSSYNDGKKGCNPSPVQSCYRSRCSKEYSDSPHTRWGRTEPGWRCSSAGWRHWRPSPSCEAQRSEPKTEKFRFIENGPLVSSSQTLVMDVDYYCSWAKHTSWNPSSWLTLYSVSSCIRPVQQPDPQHSFMCYLSIPFIFIYTASVPIKMISRPFRETQGLTPNRQHWEGKTRL